MYDDMIRDLINIESFIRRLYNDLCELEVNNQKEGCFYSHLINELKDS